MHDGIAFAEHDQQAALEGVTVQQERNQTWNGALSVVQTFSEVPSLFNGIRHKISDGLDENLQANKPILNLGCVQS